MVNSISSVEPKRQAIIKTTASAVAGAGIGAGAAYLLQSRAIKKEKIAQEAAKNKSFIDKTLSKIKDLYVAIKTKYADNMGKIAKSGKISKMGLAKAAGLGAVVLGGAVYLKSKFSKKED